MITDQYYENNYYHLTMAREGKYLMISCQQFVDLHVLEASASQYDPMRYFCSDICIVTVTVASYIPEL